MTRLLSLLLVPSILFACGPKGEGDDTGDSPLDSDETGETADTADTADSTDSADTGPTDGDGDGWTSDVDCDDGDATVNPAATEICDEADVDEDCDGTADDDGAEGAVDLYQDLDGDGWGSRVVVHACPDSPGTAVRDGDCNDAYAEVSPDGTEVCDEADLDEDCDGAADDADTDPAGTTSWHADADEDGWGDADVVVSACDPGPGRTWRPGDCADADAAVSPSVVEECEATEDQNCDGRLPDCSISGEITLETSEDVRVLRSSTPLGRFGATLARAGDVDGDGREDLWVAATAGDAEDAAVGMGAVHLFLGPLSDGGTVADAVSSFYADWDGGDFGRSLAGGGDLDGDGQPDLVVGSTDEGGVRGAFVFFAVSDGDRAGGDADAYFKPGRGSEDPGNHGMLVADWSGDGADDLLLFASGTETVGLCAGPIPSGERSLTECAQIDTPDVNTSRTQAGRFLDASDIDGDGVLDLALGAPELTSRGPGAAWILLGPLEDGLDVVDDADTKLVGADSMQVGCAVDVQGDFDGDGLRDLAVGAPGGERDGITGGAALVLSGASRGSVQVEEVATRIYGDVSSAELGTELRFVGDLNADGAADLAVAAPSELRRTMTEGAVYFFYGPDQGVYTQGAADLHVVPPHEQAALGSALLGVDLDGDGAEELIMGAPGSEEAEDQAGVAWLLSTSYR